MILQEYELALLSSSSSPNNEERLELMGCIYDQENSEIVAEFNICVVVKQIYGFIFHYLFFLLPHSKFMVLFFILILFLLPHSQCHSTTRL
jgi:hypothetical protein